MRFAADITLAKDRLGFKPQVDLKEGLSKYVDWFINQRHIGDY